MPPQPVAVLALPSSRQLAALALTAGLLLAVFESTRLDLAVEALFFDPDQGAFPLQHFWFFEEVMHHGLKTLLVALTVIALAVCLLAWRERIAWLPPRHALGVALGLIALPLATTLLKQLIHRHCPWNIADFGGFAPYLGLLDEPGGDVTPGACFPAGHASAGFAWIVWAFFLRDLHPGWSRLALWGGLGLGLTMGLVRMVQGAHFLSHVLWSAWLAWALAFALSAALRQRCPSLPLVACHES